MIRRPRWSRTRKTLALICVLCIPLNPAAALLAQSDDRLRENFLSLKDRFETLARDDTDPQALACLGAETAALAWSLAVIAQTEDPEAREEWRNRAEAFETSIEISKNWDDRHLQALELYYQALWESTLYLVTKNEQPGLARDLRSIAEQTRKKLATLTDHPELNLEKRVLWSAALVGLASVAVRSLGGGTLARPVERIMKDLVARAEAVDRRSDLHYRAKLSLLYINNLQGFTALIFLLGRNAGPPLSRELAALHGMLNKYGPRRSLPDALSLTWTAQAQASLPVAFWLATWAPPEGEGDQAGDD